MSRCFPYPPPGCYGKILYDEALIESIKLQREREREREKAKAEKKKARRKQKKEKKRREKKEKAKLNSSDTSNSHKLESISGDYGSGQIERSELTEEHEQLTDSNNRCNSTDSTQNSNKRKRDYLASKEQPWLTGSTTRFGLCSFENEMQGLGWDFPPLKPEGDDLEWLCRRNIEDGNRERRFKTSCEVSSCGSEVHMPHAQYLAEADIYKLPYTVPF